jgi:hypothetical protein
MEKLEEHLLEPEGIDVYINVYDLLAENDYGVNYISIPILTA